MEALFHLTKKANLRPGTNPESECKNKPNFNETLTFDCLQGEKMAYSREELSKKLLEMYPEIEKFGLSLSLDFDESKNAWVVTLEKDNHKRHAFLDKKDADSCIEGNACIYLGMLIAQYIKDLEMEISGK